MRPITATQTYYYLSLSYASVCPSRISIAAKLFSILSIRLCFGLPSDLFPWGLYFKTAFLDYLTSIHDQPMRFFYIVILLLCMILYITVVIKYCFLFHIVVLYYFFLTHIFFFQWLLFYLLLLWSLATFHTHIKGLVW